MRIASGAKSPALLSPVVQAFCRKWPLPQGASTVDSPESRNLIDPESRRQQLGHSFAQLAPRSNPRGIDIGHFLPRSSPLPMQLIPQPGALPRSDHSTPLHS